LCAPLFPAAGPSVALAKQTRQDDAPAKEKGQPLSLRLAFTFMFKSPLPVSTRLLWLKHRSSKN